MLGGLQTLDSYHVGIGKWYVVRGTEHVVLGVTQLTEMLLGSNQLPITVFSGNRKKRETESLCS